MCYAKYVKDTVRDVQNSDSTHLKCYILCAAGHYTSLLNAQLIGVSGQQLPQQLDTNEDLGGEDQQ